jgi:RNA polymerase sigma-70 factor (ECF subfamily)
MVNDFTALYERYAGDISRFALYLTSDRTLAEDITSETFLRAWTSGSAIRAATVKGYLITIARNLYLQQLRERRKRADLPPDVEDPSPDSAREAENRSELEQVLRDLRQVPESDRAALLMYAVEEMPYQEIADAIGVSLAAVKVKIHRTRLRLAQMRSARRFAA